MGCQEISYEKVNSQCKERKHPYDSLTGGCARAGALERFVGNAQEKDALVAAVGRECERAAQMDWAVELYLYAGAPRAALALINQQLSNALQPALTDARKGAAPGLLVPQVLLRGRLSGRDECRGLRLAP